MTSRLAIGHKRACIASETNMYSTTCTLVTCVFYHKHESHGLTARWLSKSCTWNESVKTMLRSQARQVCGQIFEFSLASTIHHRKTPQRSCSKRIIISCNLCDNIKICQLHCTSTCTINVTSTKILLNRLICFWHFQWFLSLKVSDFTCECTHHLGRWWMMPTSINQLWMGWIRLLLQNVQCHMGMTDVQNCAHRHVWTTHLRQQCGGPCRGPCREMWSRWPFIGPWGINRKCSWDFYLIYADRAAVVWFWFVNIGASLWTPGLHVSNCLGFISRPQRLDSITCPVWGLGRL